MSNERRGRDDARRPEDSPVAWFVVLEHAWQTNDFDLVARAHRELERLGVLIRFPRQRRGGA